MDYISVYDTECSFYVAQTHTLVILLKFLPVIFVVNERVVHVISYSCIPRRADLSAGPFLLTWAKPRVTLASVHEAQKEVFLISVIFIHPLTLCAILVSIQLLIEVSVSENYDGFLKQLLRKDAIRKLRFLKPHIICDL